MKQHTLLKQSTLLLFFLIIAVVLFGFLSAGKYKTSNHAVLEMSSHPDFLVTYGELQQLLEAGQEQHILFIDLRSNEEFAAGHIPGAINIPLHKLLSDKHAKHVKRDNPLLLYAAQEQDAVYATMMLMGKGYTNSRALAGSFQLIEEQVLTGSLPVTFRYYHEEKANFDFPRYVGNNQVSQREEAKKELPVIPQIKTETIGVQGGC